MCASTSFSVELLAVISMHEFLDMPGRYGGEGSEQEVINVSSVNEAWTHRGII